MKHPPLNQADDSKWRKVEDKCDYLCPHCGKVSDGSKGMNPYCTHCGLDRKWTSETEVRAALTKIVYHKMEPALRYAAAYAEKGLNMTGSMLFTQVLYVRANLASWRDKEAGIVRSTLTKYLEERRNAKTEKHS